MIANNHKNLAILVGINAYGNGIPSLKTPVNDVTGLAKVLQSSYQYDVKLLLDSEATLEGINTLLDNLKDGSLTLSDNRVVRVESYNRVLFYFAGHGITEDAFENQDGPIGYLIPQDAKKDDKRTFLPMQPLHDVLVELECRHLLVILDCCFAGAFRFLRHLLPPQKLLYREQYDRFMKGKAQQMIASASYDEKALDVVTRFGQREGENTGKNSPFAEVLLKALQIEVEEAPNGGAKAPADIIPDGVITASELYIYLEKELAGITDRQTPGLYPLKHHEKGEYVFQVPGFVPDRLEKAPPLDKSTNPYRGLKPYEAENSELFFGREQVIQDLAKQVSDPSKPPLTVVLGVSGSGKSSLVKAGLIPRLLKEGWKIFEPIRPKDFLGKSILPESEEVNEQNEEVLKVNPSWLQSLEKNLSRVPDDSSDSSSGAASKKFLLVIDQSEELVTQSSQQEKEQCLQWLQQLWTNRSEKIQVVITLRSEFELQFASELLSSGKEVVLAAILLIAIEKLYKFIPILSQIYQNWAQKQWMAARFMVPAMTQDEFRQVIEKPALEKVLYFEPPELVDKLINEVLGMPGALPLLSFTLSELYLKYLDRRSDNRAMTQEDYELLGGVMGSLKTSATRVYDELVQEDSSYEKTIRHVMLRMVAVGGGQLARRAVPEFELKYPAPEKNERVEKVVNCFREARLLVSGTDAQGKVYYEPAHDALILGWDKLLAWKQEEQENLLLQRRLTPAAQEWKTIEQSPNKAEPFINLLDKGIDLISNSLHFITIQIDRLVIRKSQNPKSDKKSKFLWDSNPRINLLEKVLKSSDNWLSDTEADFVESSIKQSRRNIAKVQSITFSVITILLVFSLIALIGQRNALIGQVNAFRDSSESSWTSNQELEALIAALQAVKGLKHPLLKVFKPTNKLQIKVKESLYKVIYQTSEVNRLEGHEQLINEVKFSPNGQYLVTASDDRTARLWDLKGKQQKSKINHEYPVKLVRVSPDGKLLATVSQIQIVRLWDLQGNELAKFQSQSAVSDIEFHPQGKFLAIGSYEGISLWDVQNDLQGKKIVKLPYIGSDFYKEVEFSPDGKFLVIDDWDKGIALWDLQNSQTLKMIDEKNARFSPKENLLATSNDNIASLWNLKGKELAQLPHKELVKEIEFSHDGDFLATVSGDSLVELWDLRDRGNLATQESTQLPHTSGINMAEFSSKSQLLATVSNDGIVHLWNLQGDKLGQFVHRDTVVDVDFSPDDKLLATALADGTAHLWNLQGKEYKKFDRQEGNVIFSPKIKYLATWNYERSAHLWNLQNGKSKPLNHLDKVTQAKFSPNGNLIGTVSNYEVIHIWNLQGNELAQLKHQEGVQKFKFSPNEKLLATSSYGENIVRVWDLQDKNSLESQKPLQLIHPDSIDDFSFSPNSKLLVTASEDRKIRVWNLQEDRSLKLELEHQNEISEIRFSPNSQFIATMSGLPDNGTAHLWDLQSQEKKKDLLNLHLDFVAWLYPRFSPDSQFLAIVSSNSNDGYVHLFDLREQKLLPQPLKQSFDAIKDVIFSPKGNSLAMLSTGNAAHLWNLEGNKQAHFPHSALIRDAQFSPDGDFLVTASEDGIVRLWNLQGQEITKLKHQTAVEQLRFSQNGQFLFTVSDDAVWQWQMGDVDQLLTIGCKRIRDYLKNNIRVKNGDRHLCKNFENVTEP